MNARRYVWNNVLSLLAPEGLEPPDGFFDSLGHSFYSMGQTWYGMGQYITGDSYGAQETWESAYKNGPHGQPKDDGGVYYYGTRGALAVATTATAAVAVGSFEFFAIGNESIKRSDRVRLLYWDSDGDALWYKRLEAGTFRFPRAEGGSQKLTLSAADFQMILSGVDLSSVKRLKRLHQCLVALLPRLGLPLSPYSFMYVGLVYTAFIAIALKRF